MKLIIITLLMFYLSQSLFASWELIYNEKQVNAIESYGNTIWLGTINDGIINSTDNGDTWNKAGLDNEAIIYINEKNDIIYVGTTNGLFYSEDKGINWNKIIFSDKDLGILNILIHNDIIALITFDSDNKNSFFISEDNGFTWFERNDGILSYHKGYICIAAINDILFLGTWDTGIFRSSNFGINWEPIGFQRENNTDYSIFEIMVNNDDLFISVSGYNIQNEVIPSVYKSIDNGDNWIKLTTSINPIQMLFFREYLFAITYNTHFVISSDFGYTWYGKSEILIENQVFLTGKVFVINEHYESIFVITRNGLFRTSLDYAMTVNVNESEMSSLSIYPNPSSDILHIQTTALITRTELTDILGRTVFKQSGNVEQIRTAGLAPGLYLLKFYTAGGEVLMEKVVVR